MAKKKEIKEAVVSEEKEKIEKEVKEEKVTAKEKEPKKEKKQKKDGFFKSIRKEMKQVVWPSGKEILKSTIAVLIMCIFLGLFFKGIELLMAVVREWLS